MCVRVCVCVSVTGFAQPGAISNAFGVNAFVLAMASFVCAAAKNKFLRMIWQPIETNLPLLLSCLVEMLGEK